VVESTKLQYNAVIKYFDFITTTYTTNE